MDIAPVLERKEEKWDTAAELQHMTSVHIQCVHLFLRWRRGRSDNSGYRKRRFVSVIATVRHATLQVICPHTGWTANSVKPTDLPVSQQRFYLNLCSCLLLSHIVLPDDCALCKLP